MKVSFLTIIFLLTSIFTQQLIGQTNKPTNQNSDYCSVFSEATENPKPIRIRALMTYSTIPRVDGGETFLYSDKCNNGDYFAVANFSKLKDSDKWGKFFEKLPAQKNFVFEVDLKGNLEVLISPLFGHLGWGRAEIKITEIESIKDVTRKAQKPNYKAERPLIEKGNTLQLVNTETLFRLLKGETQINIGDYISPAYILIDSNGQTFNRSNYQNISERELSKSFETISVSNGRVERNGDKYKVLGIVTFSQADKKHILNYENTFEFRNDWWVLTETKFSKP
jgi:hypothetical protein